MVIEKSDYEHILKTYGKGGEINYEIEEEEKERTDEEIALE